MYQPQKFIGIKDPTLVKGWLESVKNTMTFFKMTDREKVRYATYMLKFDIMVQWNLTLEIVREIEVTWVDFKKLFEAIYKTTNMTYLRAQEFINLTQSNNTVKEYSTRLNELA